MKASAIFRGGLYRYASQERDGQGNLTVHINENELLVKLKKRGRDLVVKFDETGNVLDDEDLEEIQ